jgi:hypothetical protein
MELIEGSETSAYIYQTPGNYPKENLLYSEHGESLKSRTQLTAVRYVLLAKFVQFPSFANRGLLRRLVRSASGDEGSNYSGVRAQSIFQVAVLK